ncbi:MAG: ATP-binding cassette domain-containing protein [Leifsonia flava]
MRTAIEMQGVSKSFGPTHVLDAIDLAVPEGTIFALLGPNGAGKTTMINILTTLVAPDSGSATVAGHDVVGAKTAVKRAISLTGQSVAVDEVLTGDENLRLMSRLWGLSRRESARRSAELLDTFGLQAAGRKPVKTYSGGMRRRLDLALSLIGMPAVLFLDEPTTGLDTRSRRELWSLIRDLRTAGTTVFLTTQYLEEADELADHIALLAAGRIVADGSPIELKARVGGEVVELRSAADVVLRSVPTDGSADGLRAAIDQLDADAGPGCTIGLRSPSLDDVFLQLTDRDAVAQAAQVRS